MLRGILYNRINTRDVYKGELQVPQKCFMYFLTRFLRKTGLSSELLTLTVAAFLITI